MITVPIRTVPGLNAPSIEALRSALSYDPSTGIFIRKEKTGQNVVVGSIAGWLDKQGYRRIRIDGKSYQAHRLAWQHFYGHVPHDRIDHINGKRDDNRIANLRIVDHSTNLENMRMARKDNALGILGVRARLGKYEARIMVKGRSIQLGSFDSANEASAAYLDAKRRLHKGCTL